LRLLRLLVMMQGKGILGGEDAVVGEPVSERLDAGGVELFAVVEGKLLLVDGAGEVAGKVPVVGLPVEGGTEVLLGIVPLLRAQGDAPGQGARLPPGVGVELAGLAQLGEGLLESVPVRLCGAALVLGSELLLLPGPEQVVMTAGKRPVELHALLGGRAGEA